MLTGISEIQQLCMLLTIKWENSVKTRLSHRHQVHPHGFKKAEVKCNNWAFLETGDSFT